MNPPSNHSHHAGTPGGPRAASTPGSQLLLRTGNAAAAAAAGAGKALMPMFDSLSNFVGMGNNQELLEELRWGS